MRGFQCFAPCMILPLALFQPQDQTQQSDKLQILFSAFAFPGALKTRRLSEHIYAANIGKARSIFCAFA